MQQFKRNLFIGFGISLTLLIASSIASHSSITNLLNSAQQVNHTNKIKFLLQDVIATLRDAETGQRGFLLTGDDRFLEPYTGAGQKVMTTIADVQQLTSDNPKQQEDCDKLAAIAQTRIDFLSSLVRRKKLGLPVQDSLLMVGKGYMDSARRVITNMQFREERLLEARTSELNRFASFTPKLILVASILAILVTLVSLWRVLRDFNMRAALQQSLEEKEREIARRLTIIEGIANQVSAGNYKVQVADDGEDALGSIAGSLNKMASSLDTSFSALSEREWLQTGVATLNEIVMRDQDVQTMSEAVLRYIIEYTGGKAGAIYLLNDQGQLQLTAGYALNNHHNKSLIEPGQGLAGQVALCAKALETANLEDHDYQLSFVSGDVKPRFVIAIPLLFNRVIKGVIEIAAMENLSHGAKEFLDSASFNIGIAINTAQSRARVQELLEETQSQTEELQAQHSELENINAELEAQAEKLQASEEELRVQQEELQQANGELEERSRLLEEKNELILERNLEIQGKAEELALSTRYKSEFLANMSHELRTPLNSILLLSRLLSENHPANLSAEQIEYANVIQSSGNGLLTLIDEILDLSKIEAGKMDLEYSDVPIHTLAKEVQSMFTPIAADKGIRFSVTLAEDLKNTVETDKLRLEQILRNLLSNALKFTKKGSVDLIIGMQDGAIRFSVKDTGIGIPKDKQQTIFEAFQQADGSTRRQYGGTGLGLSISRELARLLGGEIKLQSEEGKGSEFALLLPAVKGNNLAIVSQPPAPIQKPAPDPLEIPRVDSDKNIARTIPSNIPDDRESIQPGDRVILIIEDDTAFATSLLEYTRQKGYRGIVAVRGDEGVELARKFLPVGILLDIQLPVKDGWEVMDELKGDLSTRPIPVHMMSSLQAKTKSLLKGAVDFIDKPVAFEKLGQVFQKIEEALSRHPKKVMIVEENPKHAQALAYFLEQYNVHSEIRNSVSESIIALNEQSVDCVILDMVVSAQNSYDTLEEVKQSPGLENLPIIIFTGKNLSGAEEVKLKKYAESIVVKTAHSYQRILDEVSLFLHLVEENKKDGKTARYKRMGDLEEVLKGKTILVADDDVRNIFSLSKSLEKYGMNVISAIDGKEALVQLEANKTINLVLMDMMMPEMDGYESTRRIRQIPQYRNLPVIAVTAKAMTGDREKCIEAGASDYITKPVDVDQLVSLLRVWLYQ